MIRQYFFALVALAGLLLASLPAFAQAQSPFGVPVQTAPASAQVAGEAGPVTKLLAWVYARQQAFHHLLTNAVKTLKSDSGGIWLLLAASFFYGVFHAAGPGHGKAVLSSYMLANERQIKRGIALAFAAALVQALSAIAIVAVLAMALNATSMVIKSTTNILETASYGLIMLLGFWLVYRKVSALLHRKVHAHNPGHDHHGHSDGCGSCGHSHMPAPEQLAGRLSIKEAVGLVLAMGLRPCTGAILVLLFALAQGVLAAGVAATFAMAVGTAITVSMLAGLALGAKHLAMRLAGSAGHGGVLHHGIELAGAFLVLGLGSILFAAMLQGGGSPF